MIFLFPRQRRFGAVSAVSNRWPLWALHPEMQPGRLCFRDLFQVNKATVGWPLGLRHLRKNLVCHVLQGIRCMSCVIPYVGWHANAKCCQVRAIWWRDWWNSSHLHRLRAQPLPGTILDRKTLDEVYQVHAILNWHITPPWNHENGPGPKRKRSSSNHPFSGVNSLLVWRYEVAPPRTSWEPGIWSEPWEFLKTWWHGRFPPAPKLGIHVIFIHFHVEWRTCT